MISDRQVEVWISVLLRTGVLLAALVVLSGGILYLLNHGHEQPNYHVFQGAAVQLRQPNLIFRYALSGKSRSLIQLGLLLLILTPIARVAFSVVAFAVERDRMYVIMTLIVLGVLLYSLISG
jgi:uncharacterized membrane protein